MGDVCIIARRLADGHVLYGWGGNGGYFCLAGARLLEWYNNPDDVEYLFELGQTGLIGRKGSEHGGAPLIETHQLTGEGFWISRSERSIFSRIAFIDFGYFYDTDEKWYYVIPGPFRIKIPLRLIENHLDEQGYEFEYKKEVIDKVMRYILTEYVHIDSEFETLLEQNEDSVDTIKSKILYEQKLSMYKFFDHYKKIFDYFDDWVLIKTNEDDTEITDIIVKKKSDKHIETCEW